MHNWLLPEYLEDILPPEALRIERLRTSILELFRVHGYQLVIPPMLEYVESLLTGTGRDMDLATFKLVDQLSGRHMGVRADITPQVARIDAHLLNRQGVTRLCYAGSVLHTLPADLTHTREPLLVGAELYGHAGLESDVEVQRLMLAALAQTGIGRVQLDLGHIGIFAALAQHAGLDAKREEAFFLALQGKDMPALNELAGALDAGARQAMLLLPELYGGVDVLDTAAGRLPPLPEIAQAIADLRRLYEALRGEDVHVSFDLAELRGYQYHSGVVFAVYHANSYDAIARGGRYDEVGRAFGRARPATGFSLYLRQIVQLLPAAMLPAAILAPLADDPELDALVARLRDEGEVVIQELPGHGNHRAELNCNRMLAKHEGVWQIVDIS
jgi:ATP phosphoribosyltransferase regulatory subunit